MFIWNTPISTPMQMTPSSSTPVNPVPPCPFPAGRNCFVFHTVFLKKNNLFPLLFSTGLLMGQFPWVFWNRYLKESKYYHYYFLYALVNSLAARRLLRAKDNIYLFVVNITKCQRWDSSETQTRRQPGWSVCHYRPRLWAFSQSHPISLLLHSAASVKVWATHKT